MFGHGTRQSVMNGGPAVRTAGGGIPGRPEPAAPRRATHGVIGG